MTDEVTKPKGVVTFRWTGSALPSEIRPAAIPARECRDGDLGLFEPLGAAALPRCREPREQARFVSLVLQNSVVRTILTRMHMLEVEDCWLASGCLFQTVWNMRTGKSPTSGIRDYDVIYFDRNTSWEAENTVIQRAARVFSDVDACIEIRNQARVHLWYEAKFGQPFRNLTHSCHSLWRYPSRTSAIAIRTDHAGDIELYAPFGIRHALDLKVLPNRRTSIVDTYLSKARRWCGEWPKLSVEPW